MKTEQFDKVITAQLDLCQSVLTNKAVEYATADRLHNFKTASVLLDCSPIQALSGMMVKHTVSIYDMINSGGTYSQALWDEKITDSINYLLLLKAAVVEDLENE